MSLENRMRKVWFDTSKIAARNWDYRSTVLVPISWITAPGKMRCDKMIVSTKRYGDVVQIWGEVQDKRVLLETRVIIQKQRLNAILNLLRRYQPTG